MRTRRAHLRATDAQAREAESVDATHASAVDRLLLKVSGFGDSEVTRDIKDVCEQLRAMVRRSLYVCVHKYDRGSPVGTRLIAVEDLKAETERALRLFKRDWPT